jgi:putative endonuclease
MYFVYILKSSKENIYYIGQTKDPVKRLIHHNSTHARWTKRYQPWEMIYKEEMKTRSEAMKREKYLKNLKSDKLQQLISA